MNTKIISILAISLFLISCGNTSEKKSHDLGESISHEDHQQNDDMVGIELNNGEKWTVNAEMTPFILDSENILNQYADGNYKELAEQMEGKNKGLIKSCTMDGKSHEELHKWLHPHMELIESLGDAENDQKANEIIVDLKKSFVTFHTYFE